MRFGLSRDAGSHKHMFCEEVAAVLTEAMNENKTMQFLEIHQCKLGDAGVSAFFGALKQGNNLKELVLCNK